MVKDKPRLVVGKDKAYLVEGDVGSTPVTTGCVAPINPDGTLGKWEPSSSLPEDISSPQATVSSSVVESD